MIRRLFLALALALSFTSWGARAAPPPPRGSPANPLTRREADAAFARMAEQSDLAFRYLPDGCYARAHLMTRRLRKLGVAADKVWAFPPSAGEQLQVSSALAPGGRLKWQYHVAPVVSVRTGAGVVDMVIDPALFDRPVTVIDWGSALATSAGRVPWLTRAPPDAPPKLPSGKRAAGSYMPSGDPPNPDKAALDTLARYKALEPRR
jgi:hypothetical protein